MPPETMMQPYNNSRPNIKKIVALGILLLIVIFGTKILQGFLSTGELTVTIPASTTLTITDKNGKKLLESATSTTTRLKSGDYTVTAVSRTASISKQATVEGRKTTRVVLTFPAEATVEPTLSMPTSNLFASGLELSYLNQNSNRVVHIASNGTYKQFDSLEYQTVTFTSPTTGFGIGLNNNLYEFNLNTASQKQISQISSKQSIAVGTANGNVYIANGSAVYAVKSGNVLEKIYTTRQQSPAIVAGSQAIALIGSSITSSGDDPDVRNTVETISLDGKKLGELTLEGSDMHDFDVGLSWSADGSRLATTDMTGVNVYDRTLKKQAHVTEKVSSKPVWLSDSTLVYSYDSTIRKYSTADGLDSQLASFTPTTTIKEVVADTSRSYLYVTSDDDSQTTTNRINLGGQQTNSNAFTYAPFFPMLLADECEANFINLSQLSLVLFTDEESATLCQSSANSALSKYQLPSPSDVQTVLSD